MKLKFLNVVVTAGLMSVTGFSQLAYANLVSTADCQAANTATSGSCITVAQWHNTNDDFGGVKKVTYADDLFLVVSQTGTYDKSATYEMLPGYQWATQAELKERVVAARGPTNSTDGLLGYNYYNLGGWTKYVFEGVQRRDFLYADSSVAGDTLYAGHKEAYSVPSTPRVPAYAASDPATTVDIWAGFVLIKAPLPAAPSVSLSVEQDGKVTSVIGSELGDVTVTALVTDINAFDKHTVTWDGGSKLPVDPNIDGSEITFEFDPTSLDAGTYTLKVNVVENNTSEFFATAIDAKLVIETSLATLSADNDADNDGTPDADEGYGDSDQDGIADYLDDNSDTTLLPINDAQELQTVPGLKLSLGDIVRSSDGSGSRDAALSIDDIANNGGDNGGSVDNAQDFGFKAVSTIVNFNVSGLTTAGETVSVVIPLADGTVIPADALYRKYTQDQGWFNFVEDENNAIKSALKDDSGNCPAPLATDYVDGLVAGNNCIQLSIEDGGANDADGIVNSVVKDPGVLAIEFNNAPDIEIELGNDYTVTEETAFTIDASSTTDVESDAMTFLWTQLSGTPVTALSGENTDVLSFTTPNIVVDETLTFQLTVDDATKSSTENVDVLVTHYNDAPTVSIDADPAVSYEALHITLTAQGNDVNGDSVSYQWQQISGPAVTIADATADEISFLAPFVAEDTTMEFSVTASDGVETASTTTSVQIKDRAETNRRGGSISWMLALIALGGLRRKLNIG